MHSQQFTKQSIQFCNITLKYLELQTLFYINSKHSYLTDYDSRSVFYCFAINCFKHEINIWVGGIKLRYNNIIITATSNENGHNHILFIHLDVIRFAFPQLGLKRNGGLYVYFYSVVMSCCYTIILGAGTKNTILYFLIQS